MRRCRYDLFGLSGLTQPLVFPVIGQPLSGIGRDPVGGPRRRESGLDAKARDARSDQRAPDVAGDDFGGRTSGIGRRHSDHPFIVAPLDAADNTEIDHRNHRNLRISNRGQRAPDRGDAGPMHNLG